MVCWVFPDLVAGGLCWLRSAAFFGAVASQEPEQHFLLGSSLWLRHWRVHLRVRFGFRLMWRLRWVSEQTGKTATADDKGAILEAFKVGQEPGETRAETLEIQGLY